MLTKKNVYDIVTERILKQLETVNVNDYDKPWFNIQTMPRNAVTKKEYRGINVFLTYGIGTGNFATFKKWQEVDCQVRKGEKGHIITFWSRFEKKLPNGDKKKTFFLRYYNVFEASQVDGDYARNLEKNIGVMNKHEAIPHAEQLVKEYLGRESISVNKGDVACYSPVRDTITMPALGQFKSPEQYYGVHLHEMVHSTGHNSRLDRKLTGTFGSEDYAKEELIAELGSAMLCAKLGLDQFPRADHAQYIKSWLRKLKDDSKYVIQAASQAQKACDNILNIKWDNAKPEEADTVTEDMETVVENP